MPTFRSSPVPCLRLHRALTTGHYSRARASRHPRPLSAGTSGGGSCADPPPLATAWHQPSNCQRFNGTRSRRAAPPLSVCHRNRRFLRKTISFFLARRRTTPIAPHMHAGWPSTGMPVLSLSVVPSSPSSSLVESRNSPPGAGRLSLMTNYQNPERKRGHSESSIST